MSLQQMKKILFITLSVSLITNSLLSQTKTLTAKEIWQKCLNTLGKAETLSKVKTLSFTTIISGTKGEYTNHVRIKYPDKLYSEDIVSGKIISTIIINGEKGIHKSVNGTRYLAKNELKHYQETCLIFPETHYLRLGYKIELLGIVRIFDGEYYDINFKRGTDIKRYAIDVNNFHILQLQTNGTLTIMETQVINDVRLVTKSKFTAYNHISHMHSFNYAVNSKIDDNIFNIK